MTVLCLWNQWIVIRQYVYNSRHWFYFVSGILKANLNLDGVYGGRKEEGVTSYKPVERFAFYEEPKSFLVVATSESAQYANIILKKGVIKEPTAQ